MKQTPDLYRKIIQLSNEVKQELRKKGLVVPSRNKDGSITLGSFTILKDKENFYKILDKNGSVVIKNINLPQSAVLLANSLALGKQLDDTIVGKDRSYGYAVFEEALTKKAVSKSSSLEKWDIMTTKNMMAQAKKNYYKEQIVNSFQNFENSYK